MTEGDIVVNPISFVKGTAYKVFDKALKEADLKDTDLYELFMKWTKWIPKEQ